MFFVRLRYASPALCCIVSCCIALHSFVLCCFAFFYAVEHSIVLYSIVLYSIGYNIKGLLLILYDVECYYHVQESGKFKFELNRCNE
jgi:hypothetical protein